MSTTAQHEVLPCVIPRKKSQLKEKPHTGSWDMVVWIFDKNERDCSVSESTKYGVLSL